MIDKENRFTIGRSLLHPSNILEAELDAIALVLEYLLINKHIPKRRVVIYSDCLVAIRLVGQKYYPSYFSTQSKVFKIRCLIKQVLMLPNVQKVELRKVKAHTGITGNEEADKAANKFREQAYWDPKRVTKWTHSTADSFVKEELRRQRRKEYAKVCNFKCKTKASTFFHYVKTPTPKIAKVFSQLTRQEAHIMMRVICDRLPLRNFMHKMGVARDTRCEYCNRHENSIHFLFQCGRFREERRAMIKRLKDLFPTFKESSHFTAKILLYGHFQEPNKKENEVWEVTQCFYWKEICRFILSTGRFSDVFGHRVKIKER